MDCSILTLARRAFHKIALGCRAATTQGERYSKNQQYPNGVSEATRRRRQSLARVVMHAVFSAVMSRIKPEPVLRNPVGVFVRSFRIPGVAAARQPRAVVFQALRASVSWMTAEWLVRFATAGGGCATDLLHSRGRLCYILPNVTGVDSASARRSRYSLRGISIAPSRSVWGVSCWMSKSR